MCKNVQLSPVSAERDENSSKMHTLTTVALTKGISTLKRVASLVLFRIPLLSHLVANVSTMLTNWGETARALCYSKVPLDILKIIDWQSTMNEAKRNVSPPICVEGWLRSLLTALWLVEPWFQGQGKPSQHLFSHWSFWGSISSFQLHSGHARTINFLLRTLSWLKSARSCNTIRHFQSSMPVGQQLLWGPGSEC